MSWIFGAGETDIVMLAVADPPLPLHVTEYGVVAFGDMIASPEVPLPEKPTVVQEVALVALQRSVVESPDTIAVDEAMIVTMGRGNVDTFFRYSCTLQPVILLSHLMFHHV